VRSERLMTKEVGPGEPAAWDPLPPLGGPDRQRDVTRGEARVGMSKTGYRSVTVGRKTRAKRAAEERAEKEARDRRKEV
jgi:hypothetical protein